MSNRVDVWPRLTMANHTTVLVWAFICSTLLPCFGPTRALTTTAPACGWSQSLVPSHSFCAAHQPNWTTFGSVPPDWASPWLNATKGMVGTKPSPSELFESSETQLIGSWLRVSERNLHFDIRFQMTIPNPLRFFRTAFTLEELCTKFLGFLARSWLLITSWVTLLPSYFLTGFGEICIRVAKFTEGAIFSWMLLMMLSLWHVAKLGTLRTVFWLAALSIGYWLWENRIARGLIRIITFPVWLGMEFFRRVLLGTIGLLPVFMSLLSTTLSVCFFILMSPLTVPYSWSRKIYKALSPSLSSLPMEDNRGQFSTQMPPGMKMMYRGSRSLSPPGLRRREKALIGYTPKYLPVPPPKGVIAEMLSAEDRRIGYASCVRLMGGGTALLTPIHVKRDATSVAGPNGRMELRDFEVLGGCATLDYILLRGPSSWESRLGLRPKQLLTTDFVSKSQYVLFTQESGDWKAQSATLLDFNRGEFTAHYNTNPGDSGLPIFDLRGSRVVAMHQGAHVGKNSNYAVGVLPLPGFTAPDLQIYRAVESLYVANKMVDLVEDLDEGDDVRLFQGNKVLTIKMSKAAVSLPKLTGTYRGKSDWADDFEDDSIDYDEVAAGASRVTGYSVKWESGNEEPQYPLGNQKEKSEEAPRMFVPDVPALEDQTETIPTDVSGNGTLGSSSATANDCPVTDQAPPSPQVLRVPKTKEQRAAQRRAYRLRLAERKKAAKQEAISNPPPPPTAQAQAPDLKVQEIAKLVKEAVLKELRPKQPSRRSSRATTAGGQQGKHWKPRVLKQLESADSQPLRPQRVASPTGGERESGGQSSSGDVAKVLVGQILVPTQN